MKETICYTIDNMKLQQLSQSGMVMPVDEAAVMYGMSYRGFRTMYLPLEVRYGRRFCFLSQDLAMKQCGLWEKLQYEDIGRLQENGNAMCDADEVNGGTMRPPSPEKFSYYENYFRNTGKLIHPVFVDSDKNIVSGYIAYLLAKQYNLSIEVYPVFSSLPVQKIVCGKMVVPQGQEYVPAEDVRELELHGLDATVSEGEILWIRIGQEEFFIRIERIKYVTGKVLQCDTME